MTKKKKRKVWIDPDGNEIPVKYIGTDDKKRDKAISSVFTVVENLSAKITKDKEMIKYLIVDYLDKIADSYGEKWKGNTTLYNFSHTLRVDIQMSSSFSFNEKLQIAKSKIDRCIAKWSKDSDDKLKILVDKTFKTDKKGKFNTKMIFNLKTLKYKDPEWTEAVVLLNDAIIVESTKQYLKFAKKDDDGNWQQISLNFSNL